MTVPTKNRLEELSKKLMIYYRISSIGERGKDHQNMLTIFEVYSPLEFEKIYQKMKECTNLNKEIKGRGLGPLESSILCGKGLDKLLLHMKELEDELNRIGIGSETDYKSIETNCRNIYSKQGGRLYPHQVEEFHLTFIEPAKTVIEKAAKLRTETIEEYREEFKKIHGHYPERDRAEKILSKSTEIDAYRKRIEEIISVVTKKYNDMISDTYEKLHSTIPNFPSWLTDKMLSIPYDKISVEFFHNKLEESGKCNGVSFDKLKYYLTDEKRIRIVVDYTKLLYERKLFEDKKVVKNHELMELGEELKELNSKLIKSEMEFKEIVKEKPPLPIGI